MINDGAIRKTKALAEVADDLSIRQSQLALAWCLKNPNVSTAIIGATRVGQVEENVAAVEALEKLNDSVMKRIESILEDGEA
jgi:aryl-alcohol dehydrogenase-like predicted oxidoreductase